MISGLVQGSWIRLSFSEHARIETWVRDGMTITPLYDPMLAKIIVHGENRLDAIHKLIRALGETRLYGITTNLQYLHALLQEKEMSRREKCIHNF